MSLPQPRRRGRAPITAERLLAEIGRDQRETGACTATTEELAARVDRHRRHVQATIALMEAAGQIRRDYSPDPSQPGHMIRRLRLP